MRSLVAGTVLLLIATPGAKAQLDPRHSIEVKFEVDGGPVSCDDLRVELSIGENRIFPQVYRHWFLVPPKIEDLYASQPDRTKNNIEVVISCHGYTVDFSDLYPSLVAPGYWEAGMEHPPFWLSRFGRNNATEHGTWLSFLTSECFQCDPGIVTLVSHSDPQPNFVARLSRQQLTATGKEARDTAYALAVYKVDYQRNRDYLLHVLNDCLARPKESPEDDVCDEMLLEYITNLYWRGDDDLLAPLLGIADTRKDVIDAIGYFYGDLLESRTAATIGSLQNLSIQKQQTICKLAGEDDLSINSPKLERVTQQLRSIKDTAAQRCLQTVRDVAASPPWKQPTTKSQ